jgi:hypothetical protein
MVRPHFAPLKFLLKPLPVNPNPYTLSFHEWNGPAAYEFSDRDGMTA